MIDNYPNPRIGIIIPSSILVIVCILATLAFLLGGKTASRHVVAVLADSGRARVHDSITVASALSRVSLADFECQVAQARGDSLASILSAQVVRIRTRWLPGNLDTLIQRDTVRDSVLVSGADVRTILVADSSCVVRYDSLAGELSQAQFDAIQCAEAIAKRPTSCNGWSAFGAGVVSGVVAAAGACLAVR